MNYLENLQGREGIYKISNPHPFAYGRTCVLFEGSDRNNRSVCIKLFRGSPCTPSGETLLDEFMREVTAYKNLNHAHILQIIDFGESTPQNYGPFLVLPICRGGNLRRVMSSKNFFPLNEAMPILQQVALAIDFAHNSGFIHGDIKPENILFSDDISHAFLSDFGMSKYFAIEEKITTAIDFTGGGSTAYLSPEQIRDGKQSPRSDIYSFAIVAYELLTGALPFDVTVPPFRQMQSKISGDLIDPLDANPMLSVATCAALLQGLHVERKERPKTAVGFCQILVNTEKSHIKPRKGLKGFWRSLQPTSKVTIITALIAAVAGFLTTVIKIIPDLLKFMRR